MLQLSLPLSRARASGASRRGLAPAVVSAGDALGLAEWLTARLGKPIELVLTRNRSTLLSWRERRGVLEVRAHRAFLVAAEPEREALARVLAGNDRRASRLLDRFLGEVSLDGDAPPRPVVTAGRFHDLASILAELNARFFHGACRARITWGSAGSRGYRRSIQLGCYVARERLIRIHPSLDQVFVPRQYVAWVVFHEMLHETLGIAEHSPRRTLHPPELRALEETFPSFAECKAWEEQNLHRLLRFRRQRQRGRSLHP
jgi:hypothetical protein